MWAARSIFALGYPGTIQDKFDTGQNGNRGGSRHAYFPGWNPINNETRKRIMKRTLSAITCILAAAFMAAPASAREASKEETACLKAYHQLHDALANDDLAAAKKSAGDLAEKAIAAKCPSTPKHAEELAKSDSLEKAREHFKAISEECIKMMAGVDGQYVFTCPMAKADWLQTDSKQVSNPYKGKKMPTCGELKKS